ncbi:MAG: peptidoglycan D,D-transpeptidase FtsI family protein [Christensenellales bacterium]
MKQVGMNKSRKNMGFVLGVFSLAFIFLISYFIYSTLNYGQQWFTNAYNPRLSSQRAKVSTGKILDRNGVVLASSDGEQRQYNSDETLRRAVSHVVGDSYGMTNGAESYFAPYLLGFNSGIVDRLYASFSGRAEQGDDVVLSVDANLSSYAYQLLGSSHGAIVLSNYRTGELLVSVSSPTFDPENMDHYKDADTQDGGQEQPGALVNRVTMGRYTPGSVFKIVTAAAALKYRPDLTAMTYDCTTEPLVINGVQLNCYHNTAHGMMDLEQAFAKSCNKYFAQLALQIGAPTLRRTAEELGFNEEFLLQDFILYSSSYSPGESDSDFAFSAIGQFEDTMTPMHMNMISSSIANGGVMMEPRLLEQALNDRTTTYRMQTAKLKTVVSAEIADRLSDLMVACVEGGTGSSAGIDGLRVGGKTGTAEVATDGSKAPHSWFTGFIQDERHPIAITVVVENGGAGSAVAAPMAGKILAQAVKLGH